MNKSESKYFNTALRMDEALIALLEEKDLEYITVKEICRRAGVNRSTFYLHYETIADLTDEAMDMIDRRFESYFPRREEEITDGSAMLPLTAVSSGAIYAVIVAVTIRMLQKGLARTKQAEKANAPERASV